MLLIRHERIRHKWTQDFVAEQVEMCIRDRHQPDAARFRHVGADGFAHRRHGHIDSRRKKAHTDDQHDRANDEGQHNIERKGYDRKAQNKHDQRNGKYGGHGFGKFMPQTFQQIILPPLLKNAKTQSDSISLCFLYNISILYFQTLCKAKSARHACINLCTILKKNLKKVLTNRKK